MNESNEVSAQAWEFQRNGQYDNALNDFEKAVRSNPDDIDAVYGLALAQKTSGRKEEAIQTFNQALELISVQQQRLMSEENWNQENIRTPEEDRFIMLARMVKQRIAELGA